MKTPSNKTLILGAFCLSIVASVGAFKIGEARRVASEASRNTASAVYIDIQKTNKEGALLQRALKNIDLDATLGSSTAGNPFAPSPNDTLTDSLAKNLFLSYANQQSGNSSQSDEAIANTIVSQISTADLPRAPFTLSNISMFTPKSKDEIRAYGNAVGTIIRANYTTISNKKGMSLKEIAEIHKKIGNEIIAVKTPAALAEAHLSIANDYSLLGSSFAIIAEDEKKDPLKSLLAVRTATDAADDLNITYQNVSNYFTKNDILFVNGEPGVIWSLIVPN